MIIEVDLTGEAPAVSLAEPQDCKRFHVAVRGGEAGSLDAALSAADVGRLLPSGEAMIDTAAVRRLASGRVPESWDDEFQQMLTYAGTKGWLNEDGTAIQAHVEWPDRDPTG
ncbi:MAG TPA: hypothetical protein VFS16_07410 [Acidimicrobiia bacterium]|nr:hypothetical protein [Acidimicrobiia bacterium]